MQKEKALITSKIKLLEEKKIYNDKKEPFFYYTGPSFSRAIKIMSIGFLIFFYPEILKVGVDLFKITNLFNITMSKIISFAGIIIFIYGFKVFIEASCAKSVLEYKMSEIEIKAIDAEINRLKIDLEKVEINNFINIKNTNCKKSKRL